MTSENGLLTRVPGGFWESKLAELVPHQVLGGQGEMNRESVQYKHVAGQGGKQGGWQQRGFLRSGGMSPGEGLWRKPAAQLDEYQPMGDRMHQELEEGKWRAWSRRGWPRPGWKPAEQERRVLDRPT